MFWLVSPHWLASAGPNEFPPQMGVDGPQSLVEFFEDWTVTLSEHEPGWEDKEAMVRLRDSNGEP